MAAIPRSRIVKGSCWGCRRKRVKCDLIRPSCTRCQSSEQSCEYGSSAPIKWVGGMALRGRHAPDRSSYEAPAPPLKQPLDEESLVLYFTNSVLPRFQLMNKTLPLDLNHVMQDNSFQRTIIAVSRAHHHLSLRPNTGNSQLLRKQARHTAIQSLRERLQSDVDSAQSAQELFTINVLLCMLDGMIEPSDALNASACHLRGGIAMLNRWPGIPVEILAKRGFQAHLLSLFATMDLTHALLSGDKPFFEPLIWPMFSTVQAWWGILPNTHRFLDLLKTFSEMATLGHIVNACLPTDDGLRLVEKCLPTIEAVLAARPPVEDCAITLGDTVTTDIDKTSANAWHTFCNLYELSAVVYLNRALRLCPVNDEAVQAATRKGIEQLVDVGLPGMMAHCVILPLMIFGANCIYSQDRQAITRALEPSASFLAFGNMEMVTELLKGIWAGSDVETNWWDTFTAISDKVFIF